ncbi:MAG: glycosyltransferase family 2 protein [bacterium]|nr:glycosyltransferase family 2 protein [bacterium]
MNKISCLIPAYNEGARIGNVLGLVSRHPLITEIIVVNDASTDNTAEVAGHFPSVKLLNHDQNKGKSASVYTALISAKHELILMLDADLIGLTEKNLDDIINPVITNQADVSISLRGNSPWLWRLIGLDFISGERLFPKKLLGDEINLIPSLPSFGLEVFLNKLIITKRLHLQVANWPNVSSPFKHRKYGFWIGIKGDLKMIRDIFKTISPLTYVYQIMMMLKLKI